ncbi:MAG: leucine-rich repeat domain-containing protein [Lachnospiraceae bacterium]|nr:leucine-rich repeat domain-containing protein [Lachnospiraceae bacterium]
MGKIIRRAVAVLLCATAVMLALLPSGEAEATSTHGDYEYDGATVARYLGSDSEVTLPAWVNRVGKEAFEGYDKMTKLVLPDTVTTVDFGAFSNCRNLGTVRMSESVRTLGSSAFSGCTNLYSVSVPRTVRTIGSGVFAGCPSLSNVPISADNKNYTSFDGVIYSSDGKKLVQYLAGRPSTTYSMPTAVREIEEFAFWGANNLAKLSITPGVKAIPEYAFSNCRGLQHVTLPRSVQSIFAYSFENCDSLSYINIPDSVGYIDNRAFANTKGAKLRFIDAAGNVVKTFNSEDVESYGSGTSGGTVVSHDRDYSMDSLESGGQFDPTNVTPLDEGDVSDEHIGEGTADGAGTVQGQDISGMGLQEESGAGSGSGDSGQSELYNNGYYKASDSGTMPWDTQIEYHDYEDNMTQYDLGGGVVLGGTAVLRMSSKIPVRGFDFGNAEYEDYYGDSAAAPAEKNDDDIIGDVYASYSGDEPEVNIPSGIKRIGNRAFYKNGTLSSVSMPNSVTDIGEFAFARSSLSSIDLPEGVRNIGYAAFYTCPNLASVSIPSSVSHIDLGAFDNTPYLEDWKDHPDGDFLIVGDGVLLAYGGYGKTVSVPEGVKHIAAGAFAHKNGIEKAVIPGTVEDIGEEAFCDCTGLRELILSEGIKNIGDRAFKNSSLTAVSIPDSVEGIGLSAFDNGGKLGCVIFNGNDVPDVTYCGSATRLSAKDLRTDAFEGAENAVVSRMCDLDSGTMFSPQNYGFSGQVFTINDEDDRMLVLERCLTKPDAAGNVNINQIVEIAGLKYTLGQVKSDAFDLYRNWQDYFERRPIRIGVNGEQGDSLVDLLSGINSELSASEGTEDSSSSEGVSASITGRHFPSGEVKASIPGDNGKYILNISEDESAEPEVKAAFLHSRIPAREGGYVPMSVNLYDRTGTVPIHKLGNTKMEVSVPVPSGYEDDDTLAVAGIDDNGALSQLSSEIKEGEGGRSIDFVTGHCSTFVIYSRRQQNITESESIEETEATGSFGMSASWQTLNKKVYGISAKWFIIVILVALAGILVLYKPGRRRS